MPAAVRPGGVRGILNGTGVMARNKITFLVSDAAAQIVGVAENFARLIADRFEVEIVGPDMGAGGGRMHGASEFMVRVAAPRIYRYPEFFAGVRRLARAATGEVLSTSLPAEERTL